MKAYKLMKLRRNGTLGPLFINARQIIPVGEWLPAEAHSTKGFAYRPGWHCCFRPVAPHLSEKGRVWVECDVEQFRTYDRPESQGGAWVLAERIRINRVMEPHEVEAARA